MKVEAPDLSGLNNEPGGHRIQRVPPTERRGRVHTSTVTVAVIDTDQLPHESDVRDCDLKIEWYSGTGAGGQYRNKHQNSCRITHMPTGITAKAECRSRQNSLDSARADVKRRVQEHRQLDWQLDQAQRRKSQVGSGMRGDKIRTYRFQDDVVQDHQTGKKGSVKRVMAGDIDLLW